LAEEGHDLALDEVDIQREGEPVLVEGAHVVVVVVERKVLDMPTALLLTVAAVAHSVAVAEDKSSCLWQSWWNCCYCLYYYRRLGVEQVHRGAPV